MENREFISAKDLPTTEAEEVNVLCLENGELKQKPAKGLGGGGGGFDLILFSGSNVDERYIIQGDYNTVKEKIDNNQPTFVMVRHWYGNPGESINENTSTFICSCMYNNGYVEDLPDDALHIYYAPDGYSWFIDSDNNIYYYSW